MKASPARRLGRLTAVALAVSVPFGAPPVAGAHAGGHSPASSRPVISRFTPSLSRGAVIAHPVTSLPFDATPMGRTRWRSPTQTPWGAQPVSLLVLGARTVHRRLWLQMRLPVRPNTAIGWAPAADLQLHRTWRWVRVHTTSRRVDVYDHGRLVRSFAAVVGKPSTPTPHGLFAVYEKVREPDPTGFLGPWALHLTAHSNVLFEFGGGPGRVALHGRDGASLLDPLGSADSHGCVRVRNGDIAYLARTLADGDPILIGS